MTIRGLIQRPWQVRGFLAGRRTQVRVPIKGLPSHFVGDWHFEPPARDGEEFRGREIPPSHWRLWEGMNVGDYGGGPWEGDIEWTGPCPLGAPGTVLAIREAFHVTASNLIIYRADYPQNAIDRGLENIPDESAVSWQSPALMPIEVARLHYRVLDIRAHLVREISEEDFFAEGLRMPPIEETLSHGGDRLIDVHGWWKVDYRKIWNDMCGPGSWERDWCFAATVESINQPEESR